MREKKYWGIPFPLRTGLLAALAVYGASVALRHIEVANEFIYSLGIGVAAALAVYTSYYLEGRHQGKDRRQKDIKNG